MAHPIRPESYIKMDNFYTLTVYEKGERRCWRGQPYQVGIAKCALQAV